MTSIPSDTKIPQGSLSIKETFKRGLISLIADNSASRSRVQLLLEAISIAHEYTRHRVAARFGKVVTLVEEWDGHSEALTTEQIASLRAIVTVTSSSIANDLSSTMRASAVILAHSHLDNVLTRILMLCVVYDPVPWKQDIYRACKTRYTLRELDSIDPLKMMKDAAVQFGTQTKHLSISKRNDMLLRHIGRFAKEADVDRMSKSSLESLDHRRHDLIHANSLIRTEFDETTDYQCSAVIDHAENLIRSLAEYGDLSWDELDDLSIPDSANEND